MQEMVKTLVASIMDYTESIDQGVGITESRLAECTDDVDRAYYRAVLTQFASDKKLLLMSMSLLTLTSDNYEELTDKIEELLRKRGS